MRRSGSSFTRREFIGALSLPLLAASCRRSPYEARAFAKPDASAVALLAASYQMDLGDLILRGMRELGMDVRGRRVFLKTNMVEYEPGTVINTHPARGRRSSCRVPSRRRRVGRRRRRTGPPPRHGVSPPSDRTVRLPARRAYPLRGSEPRRRERCPARQPLHEARRDGAAARAARRRPGRVGPQAQDASLGGHDCEHEELLRRRTWRRLRLAEEHLASPRHSSFNSGPQLPRFVPISPSSTRLPPWRETARSWDRRSRRGSWRWVGTSWPWTRRVRG